MTVTAASFKVRFPEFTDTDDSLITSHIAGATLRFSAEVWGDLLDEGIMYKTADMLARSPHGNNSRLAGAVGGRQVTTYETEYNQLLAMVTAGYRIT